MNSEVKEYYDDLASTYDDSRFSNSYGRYIHLQEHRILKKRLGDSAKSQNIDVACGTGRFLEFSANGIDISPKMVEEAKKNFPEHNLSVSSAHNTSFSDNEFEHATAFHLFMHLEKPLNDEILNEMHRILKPGGKFIFDFPSAKRRKIVGYKANGWHGNTSYSLNELNQLTDEKWKMKYSSGVMILPIHHFPSWTRNFFNALDRVLAGSFLKELSSYMVVELEKR